MAAFNGNENADTYTGTEFVDQIVGGGGNAILRGLGGTMKFAVTRATT